MSVGVAGVDVSVLFSEPKIPQRTRLTHETGDHGVSVLFSEPKIPQSSDKVAKGRSTRFSALQRAENSSTVDRVVISTYVPEFQCSSASRKFLNGDYRRREQPQIEGFSALQRAENSSKCQNYQNAQSHYRFQCSSASRKFLNTAIAP